MDSKNEIAIRQFIHERNELRKLIGVIEVR